MRRPPPGAGADPKLAAQDSHPLQRVANNLEDAVVHGREALECFQDDGADVAAKQTGLSLPRANCSVAVTGVEMGFKR
jgi:hypothetical protein